MPVCPRVRVSDQSWEIPVPEYGRALDDWVWWLPVPLGFDSHQCALNAPHPVHSWESCWRFLESTVKLSPRPTPRKNFSSISVGTSTFRGLLKLLMSVVTAKSRLVFKNDSGCSAIKWCILCILISSGYHIISASLGVGLRLPKRLLGYTSLSTFPGLSSPQRNLRSLPFAIFSS
ncbi:hypothetical protein NC651_019849 [Populus alba x Populus x berolinensis]|nr:hypothetical protein NC651_019849 [Populus alba x Populus x berolinensis]